MENTKRSLRSLMAFSLIIVCFAVVMTPGSSEGESNSAKTVWQYFMGREFSFLTPAVDGYFWRKMPEIQRYGYIMGYVIGFIEGTKTTWIAATGEIHAPFEVPAPIPYGELVEAVNEFYSDYANRGVVLSWALPIIIGRITGYLSDEEANEKIQVARKASVKIRKATGIEK